ncbi:hypothetical protein LWF15_30730 [Kineosporia rhizophila]|uniref:hypothetical protein n=1 Tax=Kineosporia TaxID=49184 RepID=UPI000A44E1DD|nr:MULTISPECIES: hypothetical protein [Kineosporia]MCE0539880.1 hypothetical protein [Kineosporia rhizophila]GLY19734.1 hypothetical protein Kisp01_67480 [Kineosporia sp. NBRC 101677]
MKVPIVGEPTADPLALDGVLAGARSVRVIPRGFLVYDRDPERVPGPTGSKTVVFSDDVLVEVHDDEAAQGLRRALAVSSLSDFACMCAGDLALEFLDAGGEHLTVVRVDHPGSIGWARWQGEARVRDPAALQGWLSSHIAPDAQPRPRSRRKKPRWSVKQRAVSCREDRP